MKLKDCLTNMSSRRSQNMNEKPLTMVKILKIINECEQVKSFHLQTKKMQEKLKSLPKPGQFIMVWVPGVDEIPMSLSGCDDKGNWTIMVKNVGECTKALHGLKIGDLLGVRGPFGNYFSISTSKSILNVLVGGGTGVAPLRFLARTLKDNECDFIMIEGAKTKSKIINIDEFKDLSHSIIYCTEDGSFGFKGTAVNAFRNLLDKEELNDKKVVRVYTCGPEKMMHEIFIECKKRNLQLQASLERIMRCGLGLCGLCVLDPLGLLVCKDGPIFDSETLKKLTDFGRFKMDFTGKKVSL